MRARSLTAVVLAAAGLAVAGCFHDDGGNAEGPSQVAPEDAPLYIEATVRPTGEAAADAKAALGKVLDTDDPGAEIVSLFEQEAQEEDEPFDYEQDVAPWLGERAGLFFLTFEEGDDSQLAVILETTDPDAALESNRRLEGVSGETGEEEYEGVGYQPAKDPEDGVFGIVDDFLVQGDLESFKAAVDASNDGSLADSDTYEDSLGDLADDRLATLYGVPKEILDAIPEEQINPAGRSFFERAAGKAVTEPVVGDLTATANSFDVELSAGAEGVETPQSPLLELAPAQAWLGIGFGDIGGAIKRGLESLDQANIPGVDADTIRSQIQLATGLDLDEIAAALGDGSVFVEGTLPAQIGGALVIQTKEPEVTSDLLTKLQTLIQQRANPKEARVKPLASASGEVGFQVVDPSGELTQPVQVVQSGDKIVIGYGAQATTEALQDGGGQPLSSSPAYTSAKEQLGSLGLDVFLSFAPVFQIAESQGAAKDPDYRQAKPYIDALDYLAIGSGSDDGRALVRFIVGLK
jgi:hypothetical protein